jgi:hypothetical protein
VCLFVFSLIVFLYVALREKTCGETLIPKLYPIENISNLKTKLILNSNADRCGPNLFNYPHCEECRCHPAGTSPHFPGCQDFRHKASITCPCKDHVQGRQCDECRDTFFGLAAHSAKGCERCQCDKAGALNELDLCDKVIFRRF